MGITGHQNIGDEATVTWVRDALAQQLLLHGATLGLSSLAVGTDQLFVDALRAANISFEAVIPCAQYEATFVDEYACAKYRALLSTAKRIQQLPYAQPGEEAFFMAGKWIVAHCDLLLAVWNGLPARGLGGTADVVTVAIDSHRPWVHIDPQRRAVRFSA